MCFEAPVFGNANDPGIEIRFEDVTGDLQKIGDPYG
jgi:hypothetical protein